MTKETRKKLFNLLYRLEDLYEYDNTQMGKELGELISVLQVELIYCVEPKDDRYFEYLEMVKEQNKN